MGSSTWTRILLILVVSIWGSNVVMMKYLVEFFSPLLLSTIRMTIASLLLIPLVWLLEGGLRLPKRSLGYMLGLSFCSIYIHQLTLGYGVQYTTASTAALIIGTIPLLTSLLGYCVYKERMNLRKWLGILLGFLGVLFVIGGSGGLRFWPFTFGSGEFLVFLAALGYAVGNLFVKKLSEVLSPLLITAQMHLLASVFLWLSVLLWKDPIHLSAPALTLWVLLLSSTAPALATIGFNMGIQRIGPASTSMFLNGIPAASMIFAVLFLGEAIHLSHFAGFACIVTGIYLGSSHAKESQSHRQEPKGEFKNV